MAIILYPTSETSINVGNFADTIRNNPGDYDKFQVLRITHVKDLSNWVWHEFLQVIVFDTVARNLLRIVVERDTDNDKVVVRRWAPWKEGATPPSGGTNFPLALFTAYFDRPFPLSQFSPLLQEAHNSKPEYHATTANCFWYAVTVYNTSLARYGGTQKKWAFSAYRSVPAPVVWLAWLAMALPYPAASLFRQNDMMSKNASVVVSGDIPSSSVSAKKSAWEVTASGGSKYTNDAGGVPSPEVEQANRLWATINAELSKEDMVADYHEAMVDLPTSLALKNRHLEEGTTLEKFKVRLPGTHDKGSEVKPFVQDVRDLLEHLNKQVPPESIDKAFETEFDKIFSPFKADDVPEELKGMLDPESECLNPDDCENLNKAIKAHVWAIQKRMNEKKY